MGTFNDSEYSGIALVLPTLIILSFFCFSLFVLAVYLFCCNRKMNSLMGNHFNVSLYRGTLIRAVLTMSAFWIFLLSLSCFLIPTIQFYSTGLKGMKLQSSVLHTLGISGASLNRWRRGLMSCPNPGSCVASEGSASSCECQIPGSNYVATILSRVMPSGYNRFAGMLIIFEAYPIHVISIKVAIFGVVLILQTRTSSLVIMRSLISCSSNGIG